MSWYGLVDKTTGELQSVGTVIATDAAERFTVVDLGATQPDFGAFVWDKTTSAMKQRPAPVFVDRIDDIEAWLMADPDFMAAWNALSAAQKTQIRKGIRFVLARFIGPSFRQRLSDHVAELP